jgi:hypothetical protein
VIAVSLDVEWARTASVGIYRAWYVGTIWRLALVEAWIERAAARHHEIVEIASPTRWTVGQT